MVRIGKYWIACLVGVLLMTTPGAAHADANQEAARLLFKEGNRLLEQKQYAEALVRYRTSNKLLHNYKTDMNIAATLLLLGRLPEAAAAYERFLTTGRGKAPADKIQASERELLQLRKQVATVMIKCIADATVIVDGKQVGKTPLGGSIYLNAGKHQIQVSAKGQQPFHKQLVLRKGQLEVVEVPFRRMAHFGDWKEKDPPSSALPAPTPDPGTSLPRVSAPADSTLPEATDTAQLPSATPPAVEPEVDSSDGDVMLRSRRRTKTILGFSGLGLSVACVVTAAVLYGVGSSNGDDAYDKYSNSMLPASMDRYWEDVESAKGVIIGGHVMLGVASAALGFAIYQFVTRPASIDHASRHSPYHVGLSGGPGGMGVVFSGSFGGVAP